MDVNPDDIFKALANPVRRNILASLREPEKHFPDQLLPFSLGVCASQFERCGLSQSTVSAHLAVLQKAGLVRSQRVGQWVFYQRDEATITAFARAMAIELGLSVSHLLREEFSMSSLYDPITIGDIPLSNRIAMAPLTRNRAPGAIPTEAMARYYTQRASAGLLITEATAISQQGQGYAQVPGLYAPEQIAGWRAVTDAVHAAGGRIVVQMWHVGRISHVSLQPGGGAPVAPSAIAANSKTYVIAADGTGGFVPTSVPRALEVAELPGIVEDYRRAARAAIDAGFDGVEIHAANGYLIDQFLRSSSNQRDDAYGGSIENRARFLGEVLAAITGEIGAQRTGIRISPVTPANDVSDPEPQALFTHVVQKLAQHALAYIHVVEGATGGDRLHQQGDQPFDYAALRAAYRAAGGGAAWMLNNGYTRDMAEAAVAEGRADLIAFGKAFIANPDLVRRFREGAELNVPDVTTFYGGDERGYLDYPTLA